MRCRSRQCTQFIIWLRRTRLDSRWQEGFDLNHDMRESSDLEPIAQALAGSRCAAILTGAGVSAESGVPTFRDAQTGLWARFDPLQLATPEAFENDPKLVWDWYAWRRELVAQAEPNPAHYALVDIERRIADCIVVTQNVDGLHRRAGSRKVVELHGNIGRVRCSREGTVADRWDRVEGGIPRCTDCGALLRPDVVWFGETLPPAALNAAEALARRCDLMLVVGTSAEVYPAAALPTVARASGAIVVEINPVVTTLTASVDYSLRGPAGIVLPALVRKTWPDGA